MVIVECGQGRRRRGRQRGNNVGGLKTMLMFEGKDGRKT